MLLWCHNLPNTILVSGIKIRKWWTLECTILNIDKSSTSVWKYFMEIKKIKGIKYFSVKKHYYPVISEINSTLNMWKKCEKIYVEKMRKIVKKHGKKICEKYEKNTWNKYVKNMWKKARNNDFKFLHTASNFVGKE